MNYFIVILGGGESGVGAAILAKQKGYKVFLSDLGTISSSRRNTLKNHEIDFEEGGHSKDIILKADLIVKSPGISDAAPLIQQIVKNGIVVVSEIEFAYRFINKAKVIAITGTNGKTTTSLLIWHLLKTAGFRATLGGNVGKSLAALVAQGTYHYYVVEISSFQLDGIVNFKPDIGILLNITPDHMDRYDYNFSKYVTSKFRIVENLTQEEAFIYNADSCPITVEVNKRHIEACMFAISTVGNNNPNAYSAYVKNNHLIFRYEVKHKREHYRIPVSEIALIGRHNMVNTMAAVLSALHLGVPISKILKGLKTFRNAPHRLEYVMDLENVKYINDSKATNLDAAYHALNNIKENIVWIAGGIDKGNDYRHIEKLVRKKVKKLICIGKDNSGLIGFFKNRMDQILEANNMKEATKMAYDWAKKGDVVLLSPACSSFDRFNNYEDRGERFKEAAIGLKKIKEKL